MELERREENEDEVDKTIQSWTDHAITKYREQPTDANYVKHGVKEKLKEFEKVVEKATQKRKYKGRTNKTGRYAWWDPECKNKKAELNKWLKKVQKDNVYMETYSQVRTEYKNICRKKEDDKRKEYTEEIKNTKTGTQAWQYINRERKRKTGTKNNISLSQWKKYFVGLLEGAEKKATINAGRAAQEIEEIENVEHLTDRKIDKQIKKLKRKKVAGEDGIGNEAWIYR